VNGYEPFSKTMRRVLVLITVWLGSLRFPVDGEVTFSAEADDGLRLYLDDECIIDGWGKDRPRAGKARGVAGQVLPLRVEYFQSGGESYSRLYWQWAGHPRELVPRSALWHDEDDRKLAADVAAGKEQVAPGNAPGVVSVPTGSEEFKSSIYGWSREARTADEAEREAKSPIRTTSSTTRSADGTWRPSPFTPPAPRGPASAAPRCTPQAAISSTGRNPGT
jgi:hypothetical protein